MPIHRVWLLLPPRASSRGPRYDVLLDTSECLVSGSLTPLLDGARALLARGITGHLELWDASCPYPRMWGDVETLARLTVEESKTVGPRFAGWRPFAGLRGEVKTADCHPAGTVAHPAPAE